MPDKQPSGLLRRLAAMIYDSLLVLALLMLATVPFIAVRSGDAVLDSPAYQFSLVLVIYVFFVGFWTTRGRTLGMQSWGLQLEDRHGRIPGPLAASVRFVVAIVSLVTLGLGFLWQLVDRDKMSWHDRLSGTRLMHYPKPGKKKAARAAS